MNTIKKRLIKKATKHRKHIAKKYDLNKMSNKEIIALYWDLYKKGMRAEDICGDVFAGYIEPISLFDESLVRDDDFDWEDYDNWEYYWGEGYDDFSEATEDEFIEYLRENEEYINDWIKENVKD